MSENIDEMRAFAEMAQLENNRLADEEYARKNGLRWNNDNRCWDRVENLPVNLTAEVTHNTGAIRSADCLNLRFDLMSPIGLRRYAIALAEGVEKRGAMNWEKGLPVSDFINRIIKHSMEYLSGDRSEDHLGHIIFNACGAAHSEELWPHLNKDLRGPGCTPPVSSSQA